MSEPLILPRNCGNCQHFDEDCHCGLRWADSVLRGPIIEPNEVVCAKHEPLDADDVEGAAV
jgi:hypothetical protein